LIASIRMIGSGHLRFNSLRHARGRHGCLVLIGCESRTQRELVEEGHLYQEVVPGGRFYRFTLSSTGQRLLDRAEETGALP